MTNTAIFRKSTHNDSRQLEWMWQLPIVNLIYSCRKLSGHHISRHVVVYCDKKSKKGVALVAAPLSD